jgi:hypothetical protein
MNEVNGYTSIELEKILTDVEKGEENWDFIQLKMEYDCYYIWKKVSLLSYYDYYIKECTWALEKLKELHDKEQIPKCQRMLNEFFQLKNNHQKNAFTYVISHSHACDTDILFGAITKEEVWALVEKEIGFNKIMEVSSECDMSYMDNFVEGYFF